MDIFIDISPGIISDTIPAIFVDIFFDIYLHFNI